MAAGDIILSDGTTITPEDLQKIAAAVEDLIASTAKDPGQYEEVSSLTGVSSLPVFQVLGNAYKLVRVAVSILKGVDGREVSLQVNQDKTYIQWRYTDGNWQNLVAVSDLKGPAGDTPVFRTGSTGIEWKYTNEEDAAYRTLVSYDVLKLKFSDLTPEQKDELKLHYSDLTEADKAELMKPATDAASEAMAVITEAETAISETNTAKQEAIAATNNAKSVSDHPGYIGDDYHVYTWDYVTGAYKKTERVLRPEAFSIYRVYSSEDNMLADAANVPEGKFVIINTGSVEDEDTGRLYVKTDAGFDYLVDVSGMRGFTGKTPQFSVGTVVEGETMDVTMTDDGTDEAGNPKYKLNFVLMRGEQGFSPVLRVKQVTTGQPGSDAFVEIVRSGTTEEGYPIDEVSFTIPKGDTGSVDNLYQTMEIDHVPGDSDLTWTTSNGTAEPYPIGAEVYYREAPGEVTFYKLHDVVDGKAIWDEAGGGIALPGNVYLTGANYYNESVRTIKQGYLSNE